MRIRSLRKTLLVAMLGTASVVGEAAAIDIMPGDYGVVPAGTTLALLYGQYATSNSLHVGGVGDVPDSDLGTAVGIARFVHYLDVNGLPVGVQTLIPFGGFTEAKIGGAKQDTEQGLADAILAVSAWPVNTEGPYGTTVGGTVYVGLPTGKHSGDAGTLSLGSGAWTITPQIGVVQKLGDSLVLDAAADVAFRTNHNDHGLQHSRDPSIQLQAYLRYQISPTTSAAFGYSGLFGGEEEVDDVRTGIKTRSDQLRVFGATMLSPTVQVQGMLGTDLHASGGFKQDLVATVRLMKIF